MELLLQHTTQISFEQSAKILIEDPAEVDMTFVFKLDKDPERPFSYTKYNVINKENGEIIIYNIGKAKTVSLKKPIPVGSYKLKYQLYANYIVFAPDNATQPYTIEISFYINKE